MRLFFAVVIACTVGLVVWGYEWSERPLTMGKSPLDLSIESGASAREIAINIKEAGVEVSPSLLYWWFRLSGQSRKMKAGNYEIVAGTTPRSLLTKLVRGDEAFRSVTLVEGWTFRQIRLALQKAEYLNQQSQNMSDAAIMEGLGRAGVPAEGHFFPDTYTYAKGSSDIALLRRALHAMDKKLNEAWMQRSPNSPLQTPEDVLTLASIIEKETGRSSDRPLIAAVFNNRLRIGMRLQTDPTVIYGVGESFDGNLRKADLLRDTPWNTYTRTGLPPSPIAMPSEAALLAAVRPAASEALYFVAKGDGTSYFSTTLDEHNRAVNKYQRGQ